MKGLNEKEFSMEPVKIAAEALEIAKENLETAKEIINNKKNHSIDDVSEAVKTEAGFSYVLFAQNLCQLFSADRKAIVEKIKDLIKNHDSCDAVLVSTAGEALCKGNLDEDFLKAATESLDGCEMEYYLGFDDSVEILEDQDMTQYGKSIYFLACEELTRFFIDKVNEKYDIGIGEPDVKHFEFYETGRKEDDPLIIACLDKNVSYNGKSYKSYEMDLSSAAEGMLKTILETRISRDIDKEAAAELDRREAKHDIGYNRDI